MSLERSQSKMTVKKEMLIQTNEEDHVFDLNFIGSEPKYFDCTKDDLSQVELLENKDKSSCRLVYEHSLCRGFKITNNPQVNIYCEFTFYLSSKTGKYLPRPTFIKKMGDELKEKEGQKKKIIIDFKKSEEAENFWKIIGFFYKYKELVDLNAFQESYAVFDKSKHLIEFETEEHANKIKKIQEIIHSSNLSDRDIQSIFKSNKLHNLQIFNDLLTNKLDYSKYRQEHEIKDQSEESVWHHFLSANDWILGLNVDIRFLKELISEADIGISDIMGRGSSKIDILAIRDYTVLIELKKPSTKIFTNKPSSTARAGTWSFSQEFIDGISQCLAQKHQWLTSFDKKGVVSDNVFRNTVRNLDPKVIFIIGNRPIRVIRAKNHHKVLYELSSAVILVLALFSFR